MDFIIRSNTRLAFAVVVLAAALGLAIALLSQSLPARAVSHVSLFAFVALLACIWPIARRVANGTFDLLEPVVFGCAMLGMLCGVRPIITMMTGDFVLNDRFNSLPYFDDSVLLGLGCTLAFVAAYELTSVLYTAKQTSRRDAIRLSPRVAMQYGAAICLLALMLYSVYVQRAGGLGALMSQRSTELSAAVGNASEYLSAAPVAIACAAILIVLAYKGNLSRGNKLLVIALACTPALLFAFLGNRRFIIACLLLPLVIGYLASGRRPKTSRVLILVPVAFLILATIPFARTEGARKEAGGLAPIYKQSFQNPGKTIARFANGPDTDMLLYLSLQMNYQHSSGHFYNGSATLGDFALAPVPSAVFPNKPLSARNDLLTRLFGAPCTNVGGGLCPDFSVMGTFYQDFRWPGALVGMALFGMFSAGIWIRFKASRGNPYLVLLAGVTTIYLPVIIRAGLMPATSWALYFLIPTAVGIRISRQQPGRHRSTQQLPSATDSDTGRGAVPV